MNELDYIQDRMAELGAVASDPADDARAHRVQQRISRDLARRCWPVMPQRQRFQRPRRLVIPAQADAAHVTRARKAKGRSRAPRSVRSALPARSGPTDSADGDGGDGDPPAAALSEQLDYLPEHERFLERMIDRAFAAWIHSRT